MVTRPKIVHFNPPDDEAIARALVHVEDIRDSLAIIAGTFAAMQAFGKRWGPTLFVVFGLALGASPTALHAVLTNLNVKP